MNGYLGIVAGAVVAGRRIVESNKFLSHINFSFVITEDKLRRIQSGGVKNQTIPFLFGKLLNRLHNVLGNLAIESPLNYSLFISALSLRRRWRRGACCRIE